MAGYGELGGFNVLQTNTVNGGPSAEQTPAASLAHPVLLEDQKKKKERERENPKTKEPKYDREQLLLLADLCRAIIFERATCLILLHENPFSTVNQKLNQTASTCLIWNKYPRSVFFFSLFI